MTAQEADSLIQSCKANVPMYTSIDTKGTLALWLMHFGEKDYGLMKTAILLCQESVRGFPQVADIKNAIKEILLDEQTKPSKQIAYTPKRNSEIAKTFFAIQRDPVRLREYVNSMDISDVTDYVRVQFPDISDETIRRNYDEIASAKHFDEMCDSCMINPNACMTQGHSAKLYLMSNGWMKLEIVKCKKKVVSA